MQQSELDLFEEKVLDSIFGGHTQNDLIIRKGIFKYDINPQVQKYIDKFETIVKPFMDEQGYINMTEIKKYVEIPYVNLPDGKFRLIEVFNSFEPLISKLKGIL